MIPSMNEDFEFTDELPADEPSEEPIVPDGGDEAVAEAEEAGSGVVYERLPNGKLVPQD
jgi:hypothetical protein